MATSLNANTLVVLDFETTGLSPDVGDRAIEIGADILVKATKVNGVFSADPALDPTAKRFSTVSYDQVLIKKLNVMDATAIVMCRDNKLPIRVFDLTEENALVRLVRGEAIGTLVTEV